MAEQKDKKFQKYNPRQQRHKHVPVPLTPEQVEAEQVARKKALADAKAEAERMRAYDKQVDNMSHRQLVGELRRVVKREYAGKPPEPQAGLSIAIYTVLAAVLDNTRTAETRLRKDQINPTATKSMNPGW